MYELHKLEQKDCKEPLKIIEFVTSHDLRKCTQLANLLLRNRKAVEGILQETKKEKAEFVCEVLDQWIANKQGTATPCTWADLFECMKMAHLDKSKVLELEACVCTLVPPVGQSMVSPDTTTFPSANQPMDTPGAAPLPTVQGPRIPPTTSE